MLLDSTQFDRLLEAVNIDKHQSDDKTILLFVASSDVDSISAAKQLQVILQSHESHFSLNPVESYEEIHEACECLRDTQDLRTVFLINCGATEDVRRRCGLNGNVRLIVIDSHRPIWHGHKSSNDETLVFLDNDDPVPSSDIPDYEDDDEKLRTGDVNDWDREAGGSDEDEAEASPSAPKRRRRSLSDEQKKKKEQLVNYYSEKSGYGKPSALVLYCLARNIGQDKTMSLWLGILGLTDQLVHQRISREDYEKWRKAMEQDLSRHKGRAAPLTESSVNGALRHDTLTVAPISDMRLSLMRHWSLLEALQFSSYTASRMQTWTEKGRANVKLLLAKMKVPPDQSSANYASMASKHRETLPTQLQRYGVDFGLNLRSLMVDGFELRYKNDVRLTASDVVAMITVMLGKPTENATEAKMSFHDACEVLDVEINTAQIKNSMERVKHMSKAVVQQGGLAISRNQVQGSRRCKFWYLDMSGLDFTHKQDFRHPTSLYHLAIFLRDAMSRRHNTHKAMVLVGPPDNSDHCYVVALRGKEAAGVMQNNPFARPFEEVVCSLDMQLARSTFDSSLYHIRCDDAGAFIEELKAIVSQDEQDAMMAAHIAGA